MSGPILCGVDFSDDSRHALRLAAALAARLKRELVVVTVLDPLLTEAGRMSEGDGFLARTKTDLDEFASTASTNSATVVAVGDAAHELTHLAVARQATLVVVGTRGLGAAKRAFFGSTALRLLRRCTQPVLVVPAKSKLSPDGSAPFDLVVCGVDFSEESVSAAKRAVELGAALDAPVTLVHAVAPVTTPTEWDALARAAAGDRLTETTSHLTELAESLGRPATVARIGDMDDVICDVTALHERPLIVLGVGGTDGQRPGTHAFRLLTQSKAPVLVVATNN